MNTPPLTLSRFRELAEAYGANVERWPEQERSGARALLARSEQARSVLGQEESLDALLAGLAPAPVPENVLARLSRVPEVRAPRPMRLGRRALVGPAIGWAAAAALGLWLGTQSAPDEGISTPANAVTEAPEEDEALAIARGAIATLEDLP
jgi:hypothetical protein